MNWETELILRVQSISTPLLDELFKAITFLGNEEFYLLLLPILYWCVSRAAAVRLGYLFLLSTVLNVSLKDLFQVPRPDPNVVRRMVTAEGYCLPSGHAQSAAAMWTYLATQVRRAGFWVLAILLAILVGFSRVYLGVHHPTSVLAGWVIGGALAVAYAWFAARHGDRIALWPLWLRLSASILLPLIIMLMHPVADTVSASSAAMGLLVGTILERKWVRFRADGPWWLRAARFLVGCIVLLALYVGLKLILPADLFYRSLRYLLVSMWLTFLAPWLFVATRMAEREPGTT